MTKACRNRCSVGVGLLLLVFGLAAGQGGCAVRVEPRLIAPRVIENQPVRVTLTSYPGEPEAIEVVAASAVGPGWDKPAWADRCFVRPTKAEGRPGQRVQIGGTPGEGFGPLPTEADASLLPADVHRLVLRVRYAGRVWRLVLPVEIEHRDGATAYQLGSERLTDLGPAGPLTAQP